MFKLNQIQSRFRQFRQEDCFAPVRIALIYAIFATLWILFSDRIMERFTQDVHVLSILQTSKGIFFVSVTTLLIWGLIQRYWLAQHKLIEELRDSHSKLNVIFDNAPCGILECDLNGKITFSNSAYQEILEIQSKALMGRFIWDTQPDDETKQNFKSFFNNIITHQPKPELFESINLSCNKQLKILECNWDYIYDDKGQFTGLIFVVSDITKQQQQEERILHLAHYDALTQLPNRFLVKEQLDRLIQLANQKNPFVGVLYLDLDDFKKINESMGHEAGDELLKQVAKRIQTNIRYNDTLGRLGGDEFIVILAEMESVEAITSIAENLIRQFRQPFGDDQTVTLTLSIGVAICPLDGNDASQLLQHADTAMSYAKNKGRSTYVFYTESMNRYAARRLMIEHEMYEALERGEFYLFYQPQIELASGKIIGAEALLRWQNDKLGPIGPDEFIPVAEQTGLIIPIGKFVMQTAIKTAVEWQKQQSGFRMAINLSPCQFSDPDLLAFIEQQLKQYPVDPSSLELEITEGVLLSGFLNHDHLFNAFTDMGIVMAMDDFGTGYSSLSYLRRYPFAIVKIDRSFINDMSSDSGARELVNASIAMAHGLGMKVVAEGVESEEQANQLKTMQCDYVQGYYYSKPVPPDQLRSKLVSMV